MVQLLDSELSDPEYPSFLGLDAKRCADLALTLTAGAALAAIPAVFLHVSAVPELRNVGTILSFMIWSVFFAETMIMIRLHSGWGGKWLRSHKLQLLVVILANPLLIWAIGRYEVLELSPLLPLPSFLKSMKIVQILKLSKVVKLLHLGEIVTKVRAALPHIPLLVNSISVLTGVLALGIIGTVLAGDSPTPLHALDVWLEMGESMGASSARVLLVTAPLLLALGFVMRFGRRNRSVEQVRQ